MTSSAVIRVLQPSARCALLVTAHPRRLGFEMRETIKARIGDLKGMGAWVRGVDSDDHQCEHCGHPWQEHQLCATSRPPTEGWIECPVAGCECHQTWSVPPDTAAELRKHYAASESEE